MRVGIVGCGGIAGVHAWALKELGEKVVALCDIVPERAKNLAEEHAFWDAKVFDNFEEMLTDSQMDVLHICTPHYLHVPMAVSAVQKGIAVFMEKPVAISRVQMEQLKQALDLHPVKIGFCFQNRYNATTRECDRIVASKELGEVLGGKAFVTWKRDADYYSESPWKGRWETEGGGALINQSIHTLDLLLRYLGEPLCVKSSMTNHHTNDVIAVEDTVEAWLEFSGGKRGLFYASNAYVTDAPVVLELELERGRITLLEKAVLLFKEGAYSVISCEEPKGVGKDYWGSGHLRCMRDFYETLINGEKFQNDYDGVFSTVNTTLQIYENHRHAANKEE